MSEIMISALSLSTDFIQRRLEQSEELNNQTAYFVRRPNYDIVLATNTSIVDLRPQIHARLHGSGRYVAWRHKHSMDKVKFRDNICGNRNISYTMTC